MRGERDHVIEKFALCQFEKLSIFNIPPYRGNTIESEQEFRRYSCPITRFSPRLSKAWHRWDSISFLFKAIWFIMSYSEMVIGRKKKAVVHIAKEELHLDNESYRQILKGVAGVESSAQLSVAGFEKVMKRFEEMGFKGLLLDPYQPIPKGRLIPSGSPEGSESITESQRDFMNYLLERLDWDADHFQAFCRRIIKKSEPMTKRDGQKIIIGLMAILRKRAIQERAKRGES